MRRPYSQTDVYRPKRIAGLIIWGVIIVTMIVLIFALPALVDLALDLSDPVMKIMP